MPTHRVKRVFALLVALLVLSPFMNASTVFAATNLIPNPSLETAAGSDPANWHRGGWGTNTATFLYPVPGTDGASAAQISLSSYASGDAKWYSDDVAVTPGQTYLFRDAYQSNVTTNVTIQYHMSDGSYSYVWIASPPPSSGWGTASASFTVPANATALTMFHTISSIGTLTVDAFDLEQASTSPPPVVPPSSGGNLIPNATLVASSDPTTPTNWYRGGWGTNQRTLTYPVAGYNGATGLKTQITSYTDGDAKWYTDPIPVTPGTTIEYSDMYQSNVGSAVTAMFTKSDGTVQFTDLAFPTASSAWNSIHATISVPSGATTVVIFHLINTVGTLTISNPSLTVGATAAFSQGMVTFTFDDGDQSVYDNARPILDAAGIKPTLYIVSDFIGSDDYYMTLSELKDLNAEGYDIGGHTRTHSDLTTLSPAQITAEVTGNRNDLLGMGFTSVSTFAYPYGSYNDQVVQAVKDAGYTIARSVNSGYNDAASNHYLLMDQHVENNVTPEQIESWIDQAVAQKKWLILEMHNQVAGDPDLYSNSPETLQAVVDYIKAHNVKTVTMAQGAQLLNP